ncbi:hypothetical protein AX16_006716 [Volvariella volvacea WC 439]|nr:hypothetical protein AX16_006716 [Volvariella volvacea WC 439]
MLGIRRGRSTSPAKSTRSTSPTVHNNDQSTLSLHNIVNILVRLGRAKRRAQKVLLEASVPEQTHDCLVGKDPIVPATENVVIEDSYVCQDAVDVERLLRFSRIELLQVAQGDGLNALTNERWSVSISEPTVEHKHKVYEVLIHYAAQAAALDNARDPKKPVALHQVQSVPGLMTIKSRTIQDLSVVENPILAH